MPAKSPHIDEQVAARLLALGAQVLACRKALRVSAVAAAQAAHMSRVTWHRIERGEASVSMGAYLQAMVVLGLEVEVRGPEAPSQAHEGASALPVTTPPVPICLADYPELGRVAWHLPGVTTLTPLDALHLYERQWRHIDQAAMSAAEHALVAHLTRTVGRGRLLV